MTSAHPKDMAALTARFFQVAAKNAELSERMSFANTTVQIHFTEDGLEEGSCTVWLDKTPIGAEVGLVGEAEIELFGSAEVFMGMITGRVALAMAIARGDVTYTGPVRKFLRVVPILRTFDFDMFRGDPPASTNGTGATAPVVVEPATENGPSALA
jgi:hypothetical protein